MYTYVTKELPDLVNAYFPVDANTKSVMGHSMGGLGALTVGLRNSGDYASVSAFAPIGNPETSGFCTEAMETYLATGESAHYSPVALIKQKTETGTPPHHILPPTRRAPYD